MSSQDGCVNYLTKQTLTGECHYRSITRMTYPKSEIRNKDCGPFALAEPVGFFGTTRTIKRSDNWAEPLSI